jgi:outer membrane lipoprotein-sorting protein
MRMQVLLALAVGLLLAADVPKDDGPKNEAGRMFRTMEEKLATAKALECRFEIKMDPMSYKGSLFLAEGNKARLEINEATKEWPMRCRIVSDGTRLSYQDNGLDHANVSHTPKDFNRDILTWVARPGVFLPQAPLPDVRADDAKDRFPVSDFKLGNKEKVGEWEAQRLEYRLAVKGQESNYLVVIWLDLKTGLPLKRMVSPWGAKERLVLVETYTKLMLEPKVDTKNFDLPK